jgi:ABC-type transporter Mla subunit MlaD
MPTRLWDLFVQRVTTPGRQVPGQMDTLADEIASQLATLNAPAAAEMLSSLTERVAERYEQLRQDPSDVGAPPGAPKPIPVPPEVIASAIREFDEAEVLENIREMLAGDRHQLEDFLPQLQQAADTPQA